MSKVFRRPMFRRGGNVGEGIMTGIVDRGNFAEKGFAFTEEAPLPTVGELSQQNIQAILDAAGPSQAYDPLTTFLLQFGPEAVSTTGAGGTFANLIKATKDPLAAMIKEKGKESDFLRSLKVQAAGAAVKQRSEMETAQKDRYFKKELADLQADLQRDLSQKEIEAAKARADAKYLQDLELQSKRLEGEKDLRLDLLSKQTELDKAKEQKALGATYAESDYDKDLTKGSRRADYETSIRNQIATNYGESKVGGHIDVDVGNMEKTNKIMRKKIKAGGANKIYYNVNDGKAYLLTEQGLTPVTIGETISEVTEKLDTTGNQDTIKYTDPKSRFQYLNPKQIEELEKRREQNKEIPFGGTGA